MSDHDLDDRRRKAAPSMSKDEFLAWRAPRQAGTQAVNLDNPLWHWLGPHPTSHGEPVLL